MSNVQKDGAERECIGCGTPMRDRASSKCYKCRNVERTCAGCGKLFQGTRPRCHSCQKTERTCASCGTSFLGVCNKCEPCKNIDRRVRLGLVEAPIPESTPDEEWRPVVGYEGLYLISSLGKIHSLSGYNRRGGPVKTPINRNGYPEVNLTKAGKQKVFMVHILLAGAFLGPRPEGLLLRHLNGDSTDCRLGNLAYGTNAENTLDAVQHGTHNNSRKTHCPAGHAYDDENTYVLPSRPNARYCKTCSREHKSERAKAKRRGQSYSNGRSHGGSKLTHEDVAAIRSSYAAGGVTQKELAVSFGVTEATINSIVCKRAWIKSTA
jgi:hypothetical protein